MLQVMMGSMTDKFMSGKIPDRFLETCDYCRHSALSLLSSFLFLFNFLLSILGFHLEGFVIDFC